VFRLAHVTDPHFRGWEGIKLGDLAGKRAIGLTNLIVNRRRKHKAELLSAVLGDLRAQAADHLAITGDLSNVSLEGEWREALRWIERYQAPPDAVTVIPGNHDAYVADVVVAGTFERLFGKFQTSDLPAGEARAPEPYPFLRLRGPLAIIGVNSCVATGDLGAWGQVGTEQLARLETLLGSAAVAGKVRVVLIHHPPVMQKGGERRNLRDRQALAGALARAGAELVLHGHDHRDESTVLEGPAGKKIPVIGAGSASYAGSADRRARYNVYEIEQGTITLVTRAHDEPSDQFREVRREKLI
jgi:3',5'-cyclic AMP phosphodiesterase CpdA